jgi:prepilin-type N-terminal cleavage/methylation domain-containing protein
MKKGFTLVELLVVIAIMAIMTGIIITSLTSSKAKARDAQRVSDVGQLQLALALYFDRCHSYPSATGNATNDLADASAHCLNPQGGPDIVFSNYISRIPVPPSPTPPSGGYGYYVNGNNTDYVLYALLEGASTASPNSLGNIAKDYGQGSSLCDTNVHYCIGPK